MKRLTFANVPPVAERIDADTVRVNYDVQESVETIGGDTDPETGETRPTEQVTVYTCLCVEVKTPATYAKLIQAMIRQRYSVDDEIAILRQKEDKPEEFQAWYEFAENCKATAREIEL